jgi:hypothetical protein
MTVANVESVEIVGKRPLMATRGNARRSSHRSLDRKPNVSYDAAWHAKLTKTASPRSFPIGDLEGNLSVRCYKEFDNENRPAGLNAWVNFSISPAPKKASELPPMGIPR